MRSQRYARSAGDELLRNPITGIALLRARRERPRRRAAEQSNKIPSPHGSSPAKIVAYHTVRWAASCASQQIWVPIGSFGSKPARPATALMSPFAKCSRHGHRESEARSRPCWHPVADRPARKPPSRNPCFCCISSPWGGPPTPGLPVRLPQLTSGHLWGSQGPSARWISSRPSVLRRARGPPRTVRVGRDPALFPPVRVATIWHERQTAFPQCAPSRGTIRRNHRSPAPR